MKKFGMLLMLLGIFTFVGCPAGDGGAPAGPEGMVEAIDDEPVGDQETEADAGGGAAPVEEAPAEKPAE